MSSEIMLVLASLVAAAIAALSGFGIGSILTPLLAASAGAKLAVAMVAIPHFVGTALRFALVRQHVDRRVLWSFGVTSALGGLVGALLHVWLRSAVLGYVLGGLLIFAGVMGLSGASERMRFGRTGGWIAGALSGVFGGLVGNQGGIRSAALLGYNVSKESFIATATAIGLMVDLCRLPVYVATGYHEMAGEWRAILIATVGVVAGTLAGKRLLLWIPQEIYRTVVSLLIVALGIWMLVAAEG